jgi:hypothetical protein
VFAMSMLTGALTGRLMRMGVQPAVKLRLPQQQMQMTGQSVETEAALLTRLYCAVRALAIDRRC